MYQHHCGARVSSVVAAFVHLLSCSPSVRVVNRGKLDALDGVQVKRDAVGNWVYFR